MVELSETFFLTVLATGAAIFGLIIKKLASSKCDTIELCGMKIHRNIEVEEKLDEMELNQQPQPVGNRVLL